MSEKIKAHHLERKAILYVRQSSSYQVTHNEESRRLQYAMQARLQQLGCREIEVIDEDLGRSAAGTVTRRGFKRMVADVCLGKVGAVAANMQTDENVTVSANLIRLSAGRALDNWGVVDRWVANAKITNRGPSGIGVVNFGGIGFLRLKSPVETFGVGARGFNVYDGKVGSAEFDRILTHADGAVGVQIARSVDRLVVHRGIETFGATGPSLVKGVLQNLPAIALSIKTGGRVRCVEISGGLKTNGKNIPPLEQLGTVESLAIAGGFGDTDGGN